MNADEKLLLRLHAKEISFTEFKKATASMMRAWAGYLQRRWPAGEAVDVEDVEQDLLVAVFKYVPRWDPARGASLMKYVRFNAMADTKRELHRMRGNRADSRSDRLPARAARPMNNPEMVNTLLADEPNQEELHVEDARRRKLRQLARQTSDPIIRTCLNALADVGGDVEEATTKLFAHPVKRMILNAVQRGDVYRAIARSIRNAADQRRLWSVPQDLFDT